MYVVCKYTYKNIEIETSVLKELSFLKSTVGKYAMQNLEI